MGIGDAAHRLKRMLGYQTRTLYCSACGRAKSATLRMISGPGVYMCEACVRAGSALESAHSDAAAARCQFCGQLRIPVPFAYAAVLDVCENCMRMMAELLVEEDQLKQVT